MINATPVVLALIAVNVAVHAIRLLLPAQWSDIAATLGGFSAPWFVATVMGMQPDYIIFQLLSPLTYAFLHADLLHLTINMAFLLAFGTAIERRLGRLRFVALIMLASMSRRLRGFVQQVEQLTVKSATQRLASFLEKLVGVDEGSDEFELPLDKMLIAGRLGMQPETLSRALLKLRSIGVATEGHKVSIKDVAALHAINDDEK